MRRTHTKKMERFLFHFSQKTSVCLWAQTRQPNGHSFLAQPASNPRGRSGKRLEACRPPTHARARPPALGAQAITPRMQKTHRPQRLKGLPIATRKPDGRPLGLREKMPTCSTGALRRTPSPCPTCTVGDTHRRRAGSFTRCLTHLDFYLLSTRALNKDSQGNSEEHVFDQSWSKLARRLNKSGRTLIQVGQSWPELGHIPSDSDQFRPRLARG